jgi:hypothetical protein
MRPGGTLGRFHAARWNIWAGSMGQGEARRRAATVMRRAAKVMKGSDT